MTVPFFAGGAVLWMAVTACPLVSVRSCGECGPRRADGGWGGVPAPPTIECSVAPGSVHVLQDVVDGLLAGQQAGDPGAEGLVDLRVGPAVDGEGAVVLLGQLVGHRLVLRQQVGGLDVTADRDRALGGGEL